MMSVTRLQGVLYFILLLATTGWLGCERSNIKAELDRGSLGDADLLALLPGGLDAVLDVDMAGLRKLELAGELLSLLPDPALGRLAMVSDDPLFTLDALAVGMFGIGTPDADVVWVARAGDGKVGRERLFSAMRRLGEANEAEYHGVPLIETKGGQAAAILNGRSIACGNRKTVRQVIDIFRTEEHGARKQADLMQALRKAPRAKEGRPAVQLALLLSPALRERLQQLGLSELGTDGDDLAAALAVGDGIDIGVVSSYRTLSAAEAAAQSLRLRADGLRKRPTLMFLGIERFVEPLIAVAVPAGKGRTGPELHLAYRLAESELRDLLNRLSKLKDLRNKLGAGTNRE